MTDLPPGLEDFGRRLEHAAERDVAQRRRERRGRRLRGIGLPVVAAVVAAAASAGAVRLADRGGDPIAPEPSQTSPPKARNPTVVVASATAAPSGGPPWVVRAYTDAHGRACVQVARLRDGVFGQVQRGRFRPLPASAAGSCAEADARGPFVVLERRASVNLTLVYGLAIDRSPVTVTAGKHRRRVQPAGFGAFVTIFEGADPDRRFVVRSKVGGRTVEQRVP